MGHMLDHCCLQGKSQYSTDTCFITEGCTTSKMKVIFNDILKILKAEICV